MLTIPSLPTDNLYKFMAIAGLLLMGFGAVMPYLLEQQEIDLFYRKRQEADDRLMQIVRHTSEIFVKEDLQPMDERLKAFEEANVALAGIRDNEAEKFEKEFDRRRQLTWGIVDQLRWIKFIGIGLAILGFILWWWKVQSHMDVLLRLEARDGTSTLNGNVKPNHQVLPASANRRRK